MKEKVHMESSNHVFTNFKPKFLIFILLVFGFSYAQNENANENATVYGGEITTTGGENYVDFCVGDGEADIVEVRLENASGRVKQWIITDDENNILALPSNPSDVDFDGAGVGICRIWHLSYNGIKPLVDPSGQGKFTDNLADLKGKFHLSNYITVEIFQQPVGGTLEGGPFEFCVGDGEADNIPDGAIILSGNMGTNSAWVVTDVDGNILALPASPYEVNFDEAPAGICLVWHLSYEDNVSFEGVTNASELTGCYALTNPIAVNRFQQPVGGTLEGGPFEFCVDDGEVDNIPEGAITLSGNMGTNSSWVVTDADGNILGLPASPYEVNFDEAPAGTCLIWYLSYEDNVSFEGVENANDLTGCYALTNPITVNRNTAVGGTITGGPFEFIIDDVADNISDGAITLTGNIGDNSQWLVTNEDATVILGLPDSYTGPDFNAAGVGVCKIWHLSYADGLEGLVPPTEGNHLVAGLSGCFSLSNSITVTRKAPSTSRVGLFPNPAKGSVSVDLSNFGSEDVIISVYSLHNIRLYNKAFSARTLDSDKSTSLNISRYLDGIYFVSATDSKTGFTAVKRLVINQ